MYVRKESLTHDRLDVHMYEKFHENLQDQGTKNKRKTIWQQIHGLNMFCHKGFWVIMHCIQEKYFNATRKVTT